MYTFNIGCVIGKTVKKHQKCLVFREKTMPRLNKNQRLIAIGMLEAGLRHVDVAEHLGVSRGTITRLAARYRVRGTVDDLARLGRPRITTPVQDRHIRTSHLRYRCLPATYTAVVTPGREND